MLATDNHGKNVFWYVYDKQNEKYGTRLGIAPWDLDGTWGGRWDGSTTICSPEQDFDSFLWQREHGQLTLYTKLAKSQTIDWYGDLKARYAQLRRTYFSEQSLTNRFATYATLFADSHADAREQSRWAGYIFYESDHSDLQGAVSYICQWIDKRLATMDAKYGYDPDATDITSPVDRPAFYVSGGSHSLTIYAQQPGTMTLYTADGRQARTVTLCEGRNVVTNLSPAVYIVAGTKVVVLP